MALVAADQMQVQTPAVPLPVEPPEFPCPEVVYQEKDLLEDQTTDSSLSLDVVSPGSSSSSILEDFMAYQDLLCQLASSLGTQAELFQKKYL